MVLSTFSLFKTLLVSMYVFSIVYNIWFISTFIQLNWNGEKGPLPVSRKINISLLIQHCLGAGYCYIGIVFVILESYKLLLYYTISQLLLTLVFILSNSTNRFTGPLASIALLCISLVYLLRYKNRKLDSLYSNETTNSNSQQQETKLSIFFSILLILMYISSTICIGMFTKEQIELLQGQRSTISSFHQVNNLIDWKVSILSKCGILLISLIFVFLVTSLCNLFTLQDHVMENLAGILAMLLLVFVSVNSKNFFYISAVGILTILTSIFAESVNLANCNDDDEPPDRSFTDSNSTSSVKTHSTSMVSSKQCNDSNVDSPLIAAT